MELLLSTRACVLSEAGSQTQQTGQALLWLDRLRHALVDVDGLQKPVAVYCCAPPRSANSSTRLQGRSEQRCESRLAVTRRRDAHLVDYFGRGLAARSSLAGPGQRACSWRACYSAPSQTQRRQRGGTGYGSWPTATTTVTVPCGAARSSSPEGALAWAVVVMGRASHTRCYPKAARSYDGAE